MPNLLKILIMRNRDSGFLLDGIFIVAIHVRSLTTSRMNFHSSFLFPFFYPFLDSTDHLKLSLKAKGTTHLRNFGS
jgi:hypothetical protein